jgi:hypothetical protein
MIWTVDIVPCVRKSPPNHWYWLKPGDSRPKLVFCQICNAQVCVILPFYGVTTILLTSQATAEGSMIVLGDPS